MSSGFLTSITSSPDVIRHRRVRSSACAMSSCRFSSARPSSRSSAVCMSSNTSPSWTIAKATSGCRPTITVSAPRSRVMCAIVRSDRAANESITSIAVTSTMMPWARNRLTRSIRSWRSRSVSESVSAACTDGDEDRALFQDGYWHETVALARIIRSARRCGSLRSRAGVRPLRCHPAGRRRRSSSTGRARSSPGSARCPTTGR